MLLDMELELAYIRLGLRNKRLESLALRNFSLERLYLKLQRLRPGLQLGFGRINECLIEMDLGKGM